MSIKFILSAIGIAALMGTVPSHAAPFPEPIARASRGHLQCYDPDVARKTCGGLVSFKPGAKGQIVAIAVVLVSQAPTIIMTGAAFVVPKAGELCGRLSERNFEQASFSDGTGELEPMQAGFLRTVLSASLQSYFGREICGAYVTRGGVVVVKPKMDGAFIESDAKRVIWVRPEDNYRVAP